MSKAMDKASKGYEILWGEEPRSEDEGPGGNESTVDPEEDCHHHLS